MITILLVDDHELVRAGIRRIIDEIKGIKVVGEAQNGQDAIRWCRNHHADIILMDMHMPGIDGLETTKRILRYRPDIKIIILTIHTGNPIPAQAMQLGAFGYITKSATPQEMVHAIRLVTSGQRYITPDIAQKMALSQTADQSENPLCCLSERELQIMLMITKGQKVNEVSETLHLSPKTVNSYRYRIFNKLNINSDVELTHLAIRYGLVNSEMLLNGE